MKRMLINATQKEELRIALVDGQYLYDLDIESVGREQKKANIYKGTITKLNPSLEAAFVSYGGERDGFLPLKDIADSYFPEGRTGKRNIRDLREGQEVLVQIEKEIRGRKGAALTTYISLAGSFLVLKPNDGLSGGVSRHIQGRSRVELKQHLNGLNIPKGMSVIARTASLDKSRAELQQDLDALINYWLEIQKESENHQAPILIHKEIDVVTRVFRDYLRDDISEILLDNEDLFEKAKSSLLDLGRADFIPKLHLYQSEIALFSHYQIENQIESAFQREVRLKSGGSIVIDATEALTAIDINSAKSIKGADIEETALTTNLEAAEEIARQIRFRDLGGLIVIDFIDMKSNKNQRAVEDLLKESLKSDRARIQTARISRFGLLEMSRQRLSSSLREATHHICPRCEGTGTIRDNNSLSLSILRLIQEEAMKESTTQIEVIVPVDIASYLLNEKRQAIAGIESLYPDVSIIIAADSQMDTPAYKLIRRRQGEESAVLSYRLPKLIRDNEDEPEESNEEPVVEKQALLSGVKVKTSETSSSPKPKKETEVAPVATMPWISRCIQSVKKLFSTEKSVEAVPTAEAQPENAARDELSKNGPRRRTQNPRTRRPSSTRSQSANNNARSEKNSVAPKETPVDTDVNDVAVETKAPRQRSANSNANNNANISKKEVAKVRREPRTLQTPVRVQNTRSDLQTEKTAPVTTSVVNATLDVNNGLTPIPSLLNAVFDVQKKVSHHEGGNKPRSRRTLRHLRLNNQRKRRNMNGKNEHAANAPMLAVSSPEMALCRVYSDAALPVFIPAHVIAQTLEEQKKNVSNVANDQPVTTQESLGVMGVILQAVMMPTLIAPQKTIAEIDLSVPAQNTLRLDSDHIDTFDVDHQVTLLYRNHASSVMMKAPAPQEKMVKNPVKIREFSQLNRQWRGAGGLAATHSASSTQTTAR